GLNLTTVNPLPFAVWPSVIQTLSSLSTAMPCGKRNMPDPKLFTSFPVASKCRMGSSVLPPQLFAPHRSPTQPLLPSRSISTALVEPHDLPSGSLAQF